MIKKSLLPCIPMIAGMLIGAPATAAVSAAEAAKLGAELTPLGAEKAGNADGSIPRGMADSPPQHRRASPTSAPGSTTRIRMPATSRCTR